MNKLLKIVILKSFHYELIDFLMILQKELQKAIAIPKSILLKKIAAKLLGKANFLKEKSLNINFKNKFKLTLANQFKLPSINLLSKYEDQILELGNQFLKHEFNLLGSGFVDVTFKSKSDSRIDWNRDFISNYRWDSTKLSKELIYGEIKGVDVKVPWELGRLQFLPIFIYSASIENSKLKEIERDNYLREFQNIIFDFVVSNPVGYGIQWKSPMDCSIRLINILVALDLSLPFHGYFDTEFFEMINKTIAEHTEYVLNNLEWNNGLRGNHYLFDLASIIFSMCYTEVNEASSKLLKSTINEFIKEIDYQFNEDGSNFEASIPYHFFTSELVFHIFNLLIGYFQFEISEKLKIKISQIYNFCKDSILPNGDIIQIGDNDSGCLLKLLPFEHCCEEYLFKAHVLSLINSQKYQQDKINSDEFYESILSSRLSLTTRDNPKYSEQIILNKFSDFGIYLFKSNDINLQIRCGNVGQMGKGGHSHNDQLSFTFFYKGYLFITDPGTFCYTSDRTARNKFRSTDYHNALSMIGEEPNALWSKTSDDLFWLINRARPEVIQVNDNIFEGKHKGFGSIYSRKFKISKNKIEIAESFKIINQMTLNLHLHPDVKIDKFDNNIKLTQDDISININLPDQNYSIENYEYSPAYGVIQPSQRIRISIDEEIYLWSINLKN